MTRFVDTAADALRPEIAELYHPAGELPDPGRKKMKRHGPCYVYTVETGRCVMSRSRRSRRRTRDGADDEALRRACDDDQYPDECDQDGGSMDGADAWADLLPFLDPT